jgi:hypothetical protein
VSGDLTAGDGKDSVQCDDPGQVGYSSRQQAIFESSLGCGRTRTQAAFSLNKLADGEELSLTDAGDAESNSLVEAPHFAGSAEKADLDPAHLRPAGMTPGPQRPVRIVLEIPTRAEKFPAHARLRIQPKEGIGDHLGIFELALIKVPNRSCREGHLSILLGRSLMSR